MSACINFDEKGLKNWASFARAAGSGVLCHASGEKPPVGKFKLYIENNVETETFLSKELEIFAVGIPIILASKKATLFCSFDYSILKNSKESYIYVSNELSEVVVNIFHNHGVISDFACIPRNSNQAGDKCDVSRTVDASQVVIFSYESMPYMGANSTQAEPLDIYVNAI